MPQCRTALTLCIERTFLEKAIKTTTNLKNHYSVEALTFSHYHNFLNVLNVLLRHTGSELSVQQKVVTLFMQWKFTAIKKLGSSSHSLLGISQYFGSTTRLAPEILNSLKIFQFIFIVF